ncbi:MAG TPA: FAD-dependent oxidoreductase [Actinomycetota bacterium]|nr:FAD-dependent oxidoreductase [Actinomycetota bacterium]
MAERLVVIGGDAAGMTAASQARKRRGPEDLSIVAFEKGNYTSYSACGIPYFVGDVVEFDRLIVRRPEEFRAKQDIDARIRHEVVGIDLDKRTVTVVHEGAESDEPFDHLMVATGGKPLRPQLDGVDSTGIFGVQTLDDGVTIERFIEEEKPEKAVVVGGGYIGLEMAEAFQLRGLKVALVERGPQPMATMDPDMGALVADAMRGLGVELLLEESVTGFETKDGKVSAVVTDARTLPADIVVLGLGTRPNVELAERSGIPIGESGGIVVDQRMKTPVDGVWSAGDCAEKKHLVSDRPIAIALGTHANKEGRVAGINIGGGNATFPGVLGTATSKVCGYEVARTGLRESDAEQVGFEVIGVRTDSTTRAGYYPGAAPITTKLVVERGSGRLLGAQIFGKEGAAKRIDVLAMALWNGMTVDTILNVDLSYAPPFAPVWDPVLIAARRAWDQVQAEAAELR